MPRMWLRTQRGFVLSLAIAFASLFTCMTQTSAENLSVLPDELDGVPRAGMMHAHLMARANAALDAKLAGYEKLETPEQIAATAVQEDVDLVGLSCLSGAHRYLFPRVVELLRERGAGDIAVIGGGIIPDADIQPLYDQGVAQIFTPGTPMQTCVAWLQDAVAAKRRSV